VGGTDGRLRYKNLSHSQKIHCVRTQELKLIAKQQAEVELFCHGLCLLKAKDA